MGDRRKATKILPKEKFPTLFDGNSTALELGMRGIFRLGEVGCHSLCRPLNEGGTGEVKGEFAKVKKPAHFAKCRNFRVFSVSGDKDFFPADGEFSKEHSEKGDPTDPGHRIAEDGSLRTLWQIKTLPKFSEVESEALPCRLQFGD